MKSILVLIFTVFTLFASNIETDLLSVEGDYATIKIDHIDVGVSGFVVHKLTHNRSYIVNKAVVESFDKEAKEATLRLSPFTLFVNNNLPTLKLHAQKGDKAILAFGYNRGVVITPSENSYYTLTRSMKNEVFVHPDVYATFLSYRGHPTPLKEDFSDFCNNVSVGLLFFYIEQNLYTTDCQTFKILNIQKAPLEEDLEEKLPFYSRVEKIEANWFGEGSDRLKDYTSYYYKLLYNYNKNNATLESNIEKSQNKQVIKLSKSLIWED